MRRAERRRGAEADRRLLAGEEPTRPGRGTQQRLTRALEDAAFRGLQDTAARTADHATTRRLVAHAAPGAGRWLQVVPSKTLDKALTNTELSTSLQLLFGVDVYGEPLVSGRWDGELLGGRWGARARAGALVLFPSVRGCAWCGSPPVRT